MSNSPSHETEGCGPCHSVPPSPNPGKASELTSADPGTDTAELSEEGCYLCLNKELQFSQSQAAEDFFHGRDSSLVPISLYCTLRAELRALLYG